MTLDAFELFSKTYLLRTYPDRPKNRPVACATTKFSQTDDSQRAIKAKAGNSFIDINHHVDTLNTLHEINHFT